MKNSFYLNNRTDIAMKLLYFFVWERNNLVVKNLLYCKAFMKGSGGCRNNFYLPCNYLSHHKTIDVSIYILFSSISLLTICLLFILSCVWPYYSRIATLICLSYIDLCTHFMVVYYAMYPTNYIVYGVPPL